MATRLGDNAEVGKGRPGIPSHHRCHRRSVTMLYNADTIRNLQRRNSETTKPLEIPAPHNQPRTRPIYKTDVALLCPPVRLVLHPPTHIPAPHSLVGRGTASVLHSRPRGTHSLQAPVSQETHQSFILYPIPILIRQISPNLSVHPRQRIYNIYDVFPSLRDDLWSQRHGILPNWAVRTPCVCDDAFFTTRPTFDVRVARNVLVSRWKVQHGEGREGLQVIWEEVMTTMDVLKCR